MLTEEIKKMPIAQRLILMEEIWETLSSDEEKIQSPFWHSNILENRKDTIKEGKARYVSIDELKNQIS